MTIESYQGTINGVGTRVVNPHASAPGANVTEKDAKTGTLVSPEFTVTQGYLRLRQLRTPPATGTNLNAMTWRTWGVRELRGQAVKISVEDLSTGGWGNVGADQFVFSTNPAAPVRSRGSQSSFLPDRSRTALR